MKDDIDTIIESGLVCPVIESALVCPAPINPHSQILLAHGGGGRLMQQLLDTVFLPAFANPLLNARHDGAVIEFGTTRLAFTTDSYVVQPLFFPGGDIGSLAVNGTINDLAMCGARPLFLSAGFIIEEGLPMETLQRVVASMRHAAHAAGVTIVTGDTKVVDKGKGDGLFINTAGIGIIEHPLRIAPDAVQPGDAILLSGDIGRHGIAIMAMREGLNFESTLESDCAALAAPVLELIHAGIDIHCLRDLTRGGLAAALIEIAEAARLQINIEESLIPVVQEVQGACELLGFDPLHVANEGRFVAFIPAGQVNQTLDILRRHPVGQEACLIGHAQHGTAGRVTLQSRIGVQRIVDRLSGEQLPRIC